MATVPISLTDDQFLTEISSPYRRPHEPRRWATLRAEFGDSFTRVQTGLQPRPFKRAARRDESRTPRAYACDGRRPGGQYPVRGLAESAAH